MPDLFSNHTISLNSPANTSEVLLFNDEFDLTYSPKSIYVGGAGDITLITAGGDTVVFSDVPAGSVLPVRVKRIKKTGTTATNIVALGFGPRTGLWTPSEIDIKVWLDASDASTITTVDGKVSRWDDRSGNGYDLTQDTSTRRPAYEATGFNGMPTINFYLNKGLRRSGISPTLAIKTVFTVIRAENSVWDAYHGMFESTINDNVGGRNGTLRSSGDNGFWRDDLPDAVWNNGASQAPIAADMAGMDPITDINLVRVNTKLHSGSVSEMPGISVGNNDAGTSGGSGSQSEILAFDTELTEAEAQKVEGYLAWKWGIQKSLPSDHPYKAAAPTL